MAMEIQCKVNGSAKGKPRIWFTCHEADFSQLDTICELLWASHACAIYYTDDMTAPLEDAATDIGSNNLLVVPVTYKLLTTPNRAMDEDIPFALREHMPILPLMLESGLDAIYSQPDKFGELQYLCPNTTDETAIAFPEKLKKFLGSVLVSDETAQKIRNAFDAYIFLSYRKKDRRYANELMRLIHKDPRFQSIAIWYDEFLTPGESFRENIQKILANSKLFTLLVTPNLLEEGNYVMTTEYPEALKSGIPILPVKMQRTNYFRLKRRYNGMPKPIDPTDPALLAAPLSRLMKREDRTAEHLYLMGRAYLEGIDVEVDRKRGLALINRSAEKSYGPAMRKLYNMYKNGQGVPVNYRLSNYWVEQLYEFHLKNYGQEHNTTLKWLHLYASSCGDLHQYEKQLELNQLCYDLRCKSLGEKDDHTLSALGNLATAYDNVGQVEKSLELKERCYRLLCETQGEESHNAIAVLLNIATGYVALKQYEKALSIEEKCYEVLHRVLGSKHPSTLSALMNLASTYSYLGQYEKSLEIMEPCYDLRCQVLGEEHPSTVTTLSYMAYNLTQLKQYEKALHLYQTCYTIRRKILEDAHPDTKKAKRVLIQAYRNLGLEEEAAALEGE